MNESSTKSFNIKSAADMMERDALSQGINLSARKHQHLDWLELSISTATAGFMGSTTGNRINQTLETPFKKAAPTISAELQALATAATTSAAKGTHLNAAQVLTENLGNAIGNNLLQIASAGKEAVVESAIEAAKHTLEKEKPKGLAELVKSAVETAAKQSEGAWKVGDEYEGLAFSSDLFNSLEESKADATFESETYWASRKHGADQFIGNSISGSNGTRLIWNQHSETGLYDIDYDALIVKSRGKAYRTNQIRSHSYYLKSPGSPIWGDASRETQIEAIDALISSSIKKGLSAHDTAYVLAIAHVESGFNPYAAAGTTSASGLGQFIESTGAIYGINTDTRWDVKKQANALVGLYLYNRKIAYTRKVPESYIYKYHHDGTHGNFGGLAISNRQVMPKIGTFHEIIYKIF